MHSRLPTPKSWNPWKGNHYHLYPRHFEGHRVDPDGVRRSAWNECTRGQRQRGECGDNFFRQNEWHTFSVSSAEQPLVSERVQVPGTYQEAAFVSTSSFGRT